MSSSSRQVVGSRSHAPSLVPCLYLREATRGLAVACQDRTHPSGSVGRGAGAALGVCHLPPCLGRCGRDLTRLGALLCVALVGFTWTLPAPPALGQGALWAAGFTKPVFSADSALGWPWPGAVQQGWDCPLCWGCGAGKSTADTHLAAPPEPGLDEGPGSSCTGMSCGTFSRPGHPGLDPSHFRCCLGEPVSWQRTSFILAHVLRTRMCRLKQGPWEPSSGGRDK